MIYTDAEIRDIVHRLEVAQRALERIETLIDNTGPWNAELGLGQVRCIVINARLLLDSPLMYEYD